MTTKVMPQDFADRDFQRTLDRSLEQIGIGQVDLVLIHWPSRELPLAETIASLNHARARGAARHIGVSNFTVALLRGAWAPRTRRSSPTSANTTPISARTR